MFGELTAAEIEQVLQSQITGRIGCSNHDAIYVVPISYAYYNSHIYCHTHEGMKLRFMRQNPSVCFQVDILENMANWKSVICQGMFEELITDKEREMALHILLQRNFPLVTSDTVHLGANWPFAPEDHHHIKGILFRINITQKTGRFESNPATSAITF